MKLIILFFAVLASVAADEKYTTENDHLDIEAIVEHPTELKEYLDCFNDKGPCSPVPAAFKVDLAEAIKESCAKCTSAQKYMFKRFLEAIILKHPTEYQVFKQKYDPDSQHLVTLQSLLAKI